MNNRFTNQFRDELPYLWRFALRLTANHEMAEKLVQKTIFQALAKRKQFTLGSNLRSWLCTILHSIWKNELRAKAIRKNVSFNTSSVESTSSDIIVTNKTLLLKAVLKQVNHLPEAQRTVMILVCAEGYSYKEVGRILEIPVGTVMSRLARARLKIGSIFTEIDQPSSLPEKYGEHDQRGINNEL